MRRLFTILIVVGMIAGVAVGYACNTYLTADVAKQVSHYCDVFTSDVFLRLIKMIIAPLVFSTLVAGIAHMEDAASVGRVGMKTIFWFILASLVSLTIGLVMVRWLQPGVGLHIAVPTLAGKAAEVQATPFTLEIFLGHLIPASVVDAMAKNEILQIVIFSVFVGTAVASMKGAAPDVLRAVEQIAAIMLQVTRYVMLLAPLAVFAALASTVAKYGLEIIWTYAKFVGGFYLSLVILWALLFLAAFAFNGLRAFTLFAAIREPVLLALSTASSEAAYPKTLEQLEKWGIAKRIATFVLPLGYSFNLDGSMMYCTFATMFISQVYHVPLTLPQQITMLLLLMVTSKGMAGVPKASIVVIAATLAYFNLPLAGIGLILAVDQFLDMGRSATNVVGNSVAAAVVGRWEKAITKPGDVAPAASAG